MGMTENAQFFAFRHHGYGASVYFHFYMHLKKILLWNATSESCSKPPVIVQQKLKYDLLVCTHCCCCC